MAHSKDDIAFWTNGKPVYEDEVDDYYEQKETSFPMKYFVFITLIVICTLLFIITIFNV